MRKSLTKQIAMVFIGLMLLILFGNWLINSFFLEDYYVYKKQAQMVDSYEFLNGYQDSSSYATEDFLEELNVTCTENNIRVALLDSSFTVIYPGNEVGSILAATLETYLMQIDNSPKTILSTSDNYVIQKTQDRLMDREYMEIWGLLDNGGSPVNETYRIRKRRIFLLCTTCERSLTNSASNNSATTPSMNRCVCTSRSIVSPAKLFSLVNSR